MGVYNLLVCVHCVCVHCVCVICACMYACDCECFLLHPQERYLASLMPLKRDVSPWRVRHHAAIYPSHTHYTLPLPLTHPHPLTHTAPTPVKAIQRRTISEGYGGGGATLDVWDQGKLGRTLQVHVHDGKKLRCIMCVEVVCLHYLSKLAIHLALLP